MAKKATAKTPLKKDRVAKKPAVKKKAPAKAKDDPFAIPKFANRWIGDVEVVKYEIHDGVLYKIDGDGNYYKAETDRKVKKPG